jgi:hypothetical protein
MTCLAAARDRVQEAEGLPAILDAAYTAFEGMLTVIEDHQDPDDAMFISFVMAAPCAASGRDAVLFAPSLPPVPLRVTSKQTEPQRSEVTSARQLAELCELLASRLAEAAGAATQRRDQTACCQAADCARELRDFVGSVP